MIFYHRLGTKAEEDVFIYSTPETPDWMNNAGVTHDGRYMMIVQSKDTGPRNLLKIVDLQDESIKEYLAAPFNKDKESPIKPTDLVDDWIGGFEYIHNKGS